MNFKQYNEDITYNNGYRDIVCEPEIVWSYQTLYIDWNNDKEFSGENEIYAAVGNNSGDNTFSAYICDIHTFFEGRYRDFCCIVYLKTICPDKL